MRVSALGLGAAEIGSPGAEGAADSLLGVALDSGLNVIDTAECYTDSEEKLGQILGERRKQCFLFTKCGHADQPQPAGLLGRATRKLWRPVAQAAGRSLPDWDPRVLERSIERSLRRLRTDWLDLVQLHTCSEEILRRGAVIEVLQRAKKSGKARHIGYSGDGQAALYAVRSGQFDALETSLNIADQEAFDLTLPLAQKAGMGVIVKRAVANSVWRNASRPENSYHHVYWDRLQALRYDFLQEPGGIGIALRFTLSAPGVHTVLVGTTKPDHLRANIALLAAGPLEASRSEAIRARWKQVAGADWIGQG
jgi:aryl-alcohol dehydrogenase-like predicted oxidoreductase